MELAVEECRGESEKSQKYITLRKAIEKFPRHHLFELVNVFGIVRSYDAQEDLLVLYDQSLNNFEISFNNNQKHHFIDPLENVNSKFVKQIPIKSMNDSEDEDETEEKEEKRLQLCIEIGDILRINDLALCRDFTIRLIRNDACVNYNISSEEIEIIIFKNGQILHTEAEKVRFRALQKLQVERILTNPQNYKIDGYSDYFRLDLAFEILFMKVMDDSIILVCWNGKPLTHKCSNLVTIEELAYTVSHRPKNDIVLDEKTLISLYDNEDLINVTIYGEFWEFAETIKPFDYAIASGLFCKPSERIFNSYCYSVYIKQKLSFPVKSIDKRCYIGLALSQQIRRSLRSLYFEDKDSLDASTDISFVQTDLQFEQDHITDCRHSVITSHQKEVLLKFFENKHEIFGMISDNFIRISDLTQLESNQYSNTFTIRARFVAVVSQVPNSDDGSPKRTIFDNIDEIRKYGSIVHCECCNYKCSFSEFQNDDIDHDDADIACQKCNNSHCKLIVSLKILIEDSASNKQFIYFSGVLANDLFGIRSNSDFFYSDSEVPFNLSTLFRFITHISNEDECKVDIDWKISRLRREKEIVYQISDFNMIPLE